MGCKGFASRVPARHVLCLMLFFAMFVAFMLRVNLSVAIVVMVRHNVSGAFSSAVEEQDTNSCIRQQSEMPLLLHVNDNVTGSDNDVRSVKEGEGDDQREDDNGEFTWDEFAQSLVLGAFFWGYLIAQVPGGRVAEVCGPRAVLGYSLLVNGFLCILTPAFTRVHWGFLLVVRVLQGLTQGVLFPCLNAAVARWCPIGERDRFISFAVQGATIGAVVTMPLCGVVGGALGWDAIFYVTGAVALVWCIAWFALVSDSPDTHPRISQRELDFLTKNIPPRTHQTPRPVPWSRALTSPQFLLGCLPAIGNDYGFHTLLTFAPKFMRSALGFDLHKNTLLSSVPFLSQYVFALCYGSLMDLLLTRGWPVIRVRKLSTAFSHLIPALSLLILAFAGCDVVLSLAALTVAVAFVGAFSCGYFQNPLDVAPNFAGSLTGVMNALGSMTGIVASPVAGVALYHYGPLNGWRTIFLIAVATYTVTALPYILFATARLQPWNNEGDLKEEQDGHHGPSETQPMAEVEMKD